MNDKMTQPEFLEHAKVTFLRCNDVLQKKNADYSDSNDNAFRNFEAVQMFNITDVKTGILVRLTDKFTRLTNLLHKKEGQVKDETVQDTIEDAINYLVILHAYLEHEKQNKI